MHAAQLPDAQMGVVPPQSALTWHVQSHALTVGDPVAPHVKVPGGHACGALTAWMSSNAK
jgi:hypothetical protein